ncbi:gluconokinase, GntK/IdnK-type [Aliiglaciecola sp. NS0011-25]|uniref:gluconokinase n=1 Tax=Aliiglaciecola sp. NS0011-25 TaxID=3127654 RepID=UPI00310306C7
MTDSVLLDLSKPYVLIIMGVSGCGKSTIANLLSQQLSIELVEADDFHSLEAKTQMAKGIPLTDEMREPWIQGLVEHLSKNKQSSKVMAYSGLRRQHRARFRHLGLPCLFIHLITQPKELASRLEHRQNHFMPSSLIASQFAALEDTSAESDVVEIDSTQSPQKIILEIYNLLGLR